MTTTQSTATTLWLPRVFADHMVLQRDLPVRLWGKAAPGAHVSAHMASRHGTARADDHGRWRLQLPPVPAGGPYELLVTCNDETLRCADVLVGDVWLCSGQSNMAMNLGAVEDGKLEALTACDDLVRYMGVKADQGACPLGDVNGRWRSCDPGTAEEFSAVAYYFAKLLRQRVGVPVGLIVAASGHTPAQAWMSREALQSHPETAKLLEPWDAMLAREPAGLESLMSYRAALAPQFMRWNRETVDWLPRAHEARAAGKPLPPQPLYPRGVGDPQNPTVLYNGMIAPLTPLSIRGVLWYQGETNAIYGQSWLYRKLFPALIADWRRVFASPQLPFLFVQLANHGDVQCDTPQENWAELREAQLETLRIPHTAMAVTIDVGETTQIHPRNKQAVGLRLGLAALAKVYGRAVDYSGPIYREASFSADACRVSFDHVQGGLVLRGGAGFELAGDDRAWKPAAARVDGDALVLSSPAVPRPVACRYAWSDDPPSTLFNGVGLPASPFRSDTWPRHTQPR